MADKGIIKVAEKVEKLAEVTREELDNVGTVSSMVEVLSEANDVEKSAKDAKALAVKKVKSLFEDEGREGHAVTLYNFEIGKKVCLEVIGGATDISGDAVLDGLYRLYGEEPGDKDGKAWAAWVEMTVPRPRELDEEKVLAFIKSNPDVAKVVERSTTMSDFAHKLVVRNVTKAERESHSVGGLDSGLYVRC